MEQFHSQRSEKLLKSDKYLEPASSSDEEYSDEVCMCLHKHLFALPHTKINANPNG